MELDPQTASIGGQADSTWNRTRAAAVSERARSPPSGGWSEPATQSQQLQENREQTVSLMLEVAALEAEVEEKERRLQAITRQYERLLTEKDEQLANQTSTTRREERSGTLLSAISTVLPGR